MSDARPLVIAHLSDLHYGSPYYMPNLASEVAHEINALRPDVVVATGDITDMGFRQEFKGAAEVMGGIECPRKLVLPGNHDARNVGEEHFEEYFGERKGELLIEGVRMLGLDSSEPDLDDGRVGRESYRWIQERFDQPEEFKILCMHHHLIPVPGTGRERNIVYDAGDLLRVLAQTGVHLVLCGHKHVPNVWRLEDMVIVNAGTACSHRLRGRVRPSYNVLEVYPDRVRVTLRHPFGPSEVVADYRSLKPVCPWRPVGPPSEYPKGA